MVSACCSAKSKSEICKLLILANTSSVVARNHKRTSVATWSLRLLPVCKRLPASPILSVRRFSMFKCTSSKSSNHSNLPALISAKISPKPDSIAITSVCAIMPCAPSMRACAIEPAISNSAKRLSKLTEAVYCLTNSATGSLNRPDQLSAFLFNEFSDTLYSLYLFYL